MKTFIEVKQGLCYIEYEYYIKRFKIDELVFLKKSIENTLKQYKDENINDEIIKHLNNKEKKDYSQKYNDEDLLKKIKRQKTKKLYLISENNKFLKIGVSEDVNKRLKQIKTSNHNHLRILYNLKGLGKIENIIHEHFYKLHKENEWFYYSDLIINLFEKLSTNVDLFKELDSKEDLKYAFYKLTKL
jgi:phosphosulfolactate phosphohydrolase-like enzyme